MKDVTRTDATLPGLLKRNAETRAAAPAMREKSMGIWRTLSWADYYRLVGDFAHGLAELGFRRGDVLAVLGDNRPRLYAAQLAAMALGGVPTPLYQDAAPEELVYVLAHAEASVLIAEDQEQVDKILLIRARLPKLRAIVYDDARGMFHYKDELLRSFASVEELGREHRAKNPGFVVSEIAKAKPGDVALICYTSGTTGNPKGAMLSHANLIAGASAFLERTDLRPDDDWLAYLPMAWIGDAVYTLVLQMMIGFACNCPEGPLTVQRDLREIGPSAFLAAPRIWENLLTQIQVKANDARAMQPSGAARSSTSQASPGSPAAMARTSTAPARRRWSRSRARSRWSSPSRAFASTRSARARSKRRSTPASPTSAGAVAWGKSGRHSRTIRRSIAWDCRRRSRRRCCGSRATRRVTSPGRRSP
jgi:long-chain acyl-CoA synthetase